MNEGKLNQSQRITLVTNNAKLFAGVGPEDLGIEQIGVFYQDGRARFKGTRTPTAVAGRKFKIVQGMNQSYDPALKRAQIPSWNHETLEFTGKQIARWFGTPAKPFTKEEIVAIGFDGVDPAKGLKVLKGQNTKLHVHLTGGPIFKLRPTTDWLEQELFIDADCIADNEPGSFQAQQNVMKKIISQWNDRKFGNIPLSRFVKATGISTCAQDGSGFVNYTSYRTTLVDNGRDLDLGLVQAQYPGLGIKRVKRDGLISTYEATQLAATATPAAVSLYTFPVLPNCATCPTGYTLRAAGSVFEVTVASEEVPADQTGQVSKTRLSQGVEQDVWQYVMPANQDKAAFTTGVTTGTGSTPDAEVAYIGIQEALCIPPAAGTVAWTSTGTAKKATKAYTITLRDTVCGTDRLADLQAIYGSGVAIDTTAGLVTANCSHRYTLNVTSDVVVDDPCGLEIYPYTAPDAFEGTTWVEGPAAAPATGCNCGVVFEGARFVRPVTDTTYPYIGYDKKDFDPVHIRISNFSQDYTGAVCQDSFPFTFLQQADYQTGYGRDVISNELDSLGYFGKGPYNYHPVVREIYGDKFLAKPDQYYDEYVLEVAKPHKDGAYFGQTVDYISYRFYFPVGQGKEFETAINGLVASADVDLLEVNL